MFVKLNKTIVLAFMALLLLVMIPAGFAADNGTDILSYETANTTQAVSVSLDDNVLAASNDYYFNASCETDGNGTVDNPYKYLTSARIPSNANLYLANGEYHLDTSKTIQQVNIIGSDVDRTIIKYDGVAFTVSNQLTVKNVTFICAAISNNAKFTATNTVFEDCSGSVPDMYMNNYGGAIFTDKKYATANSYINIDNCTFKSNYAEYGGAIYMNIGSLNVTNCLFYDNVARNYGGAIAYEGNGTVTVSKSRFYNSLSEADAGGSIYIRNATGFHADNIEVVNSSSTFGGAITTLHTPVSLSRVNISNSSAKYDGGAIFHMYGNFSLSYSTFDNNSASNGGAIFIDNSTNAIFMYNTFTNNRANNTGGAIYSLLNKLNAPFKRFNEFKSNVAANERDFYDTSKISLVIGSGNYTMYNVNITPINSLPSKYSLVDEGYITSIKDQQTGGNCWAFTSMAILESCVLKITGETLDLSEENMKNLIALYSDYGWKIDTNQGGYDYMPWAYLASWLGPINEIDDLYDDKSTLSPILNSVIHVQNIKFLHRNSFTDNDEIKRAILNYGAVGTGIYQDSYYLNTRTHAYYCWRAIGSDHAVTIVGWDDDYSKTNFKWNNYIEGNGAWIVKNSWGSTWEDGGYYYVSYYDVNFARVGYLNTAYAIILNDTIRYDRNYQYDIAGVTDYFLNSSSTVWYKNVFTAASDEYLAAASTYFQKACDWTLSVLVNGELKDVLSGTTDPGYYTFKLNKHIPLKAGDVFEVIFNITTEGEAAFPISEPVSLNKLVFDPQTSFVSYDGENWTDLYGLFWVYSTHKYYSQAACIKAFTYLNPINTLTNLSIAYTEGSPLNITAIVVDEYGNLVKYGNVSFNVNGEKQSAGVVNGMASWLYDYNQRINTISVSFNAEGYNSSSNSTVYTVPKKSLKLGLNITQSYNDVDIRVTANRLINETVRVYVNGKENLLNLINGTNTLKLKNLSNNIYEVSVQLSDDSDYESDVVSASFIINLFKTSIISGDLTVTDDKNFIYTVTLMDENGRKLADKEIVFKINNVSYTNGTDENGQAVLVVKLNKGVYDINISFEGDNDNFKSNAANTIKVKGKVLISLDINTFRNTAFINVYATNNINETFTVLVNNKPYNVTSKNGFASIKLDNLSNDTYDVRVSLDKDEYEFNEANSQFVIYSYNLVEVNADIVISGYDVTVNIEVENAGGSVIVMVDGTYDIVKLKNSKANYTIKNIAPGNHSIIVIHEDSSSFFKSEVFNIPKRESSVELTINNAKVGEKSTIIVEATPEAIGLVSIDINGTEYLINLSKTNSLDVVLHEVGEYPIVATYLGDETYDSSKSKYYSLAVTDKLRRDVSIEVPDNIRVGKNAEFNVLGDISGDVEIYVDGQLQNVKNNRFTFKPLKAGSHIINIVAVENGDYHALNKSVPFDAVKNDANIHVNLPKTIMVGQTITINPVTDSDGSLTVRINGETIESSYLIPFKTTFVIAVESSETDMFNKGYYSTTFTPQKQSSKVSIDVNAGKAGEISIITVKVTDGARGIVIVNINGTDYSINLNKTNKLEVNLTKSGEYSLLATYLGDEKYDGSYNSAKFNVAEPITPEQDNNVTVIVDGVSYSGVLVNGTVSVTTDSVEAEANVTVIVDGVEYVAELVNGTVSVITDKEEPNNNVTVVVDGVSYSAVLVNGTVSVITDKEEPNNNVTVIVDGIEYPAEIIDGKVVIGTNSTVPEKEIAKVAVSVPENIKPGESGAVDVSIPGATGNVSVIVDGVETVVLLDKNGAAHFLLENVSSGLHSVVVVYSGDETHAPAYSASSFTTDEIAPVIQLVSEFRDITISDDFTVSMVLKDEMGNVIADAPITYTVNGVVKTTMTDKNGKFSIECEGDAAIFISYAGNEMTVATNNTLTLNAPKVPTVVKAESHFNIPNRAITLNGYAVDTDAGEEGIYYTNVLLDAKGKPIADAYIEFAVNNKIYNRTTYENGSFKEYKLNMKTAGRYTMAFNYAGDDNYTNTFACVCVDLDKKPITIKASAKSYKASVKTKKYTVTLSTIAGSSHDGKVHLKSGLKVTLKVNGKTYTGKTNSNGKVTFKITNLNKKGKYVANISYKGDRTYEEAEKSVKLTIK